MCSNRLSRATKVAGRLAVVAVASLALAACSMRSAVPGPEVAQAISPAGSGASQYLPFEAPAASSFRSIFSFDGANGFSPEAGLVQVGTTLYGTTNLGGSAGNGVVYKITTSGTEQTIYSFNAGTDGSSPISALTYLNGVLYGTTAAGGPTDGESSLASRQAALKRCCTPSATVPMEVTRLLGSSTLEACCMARRQAAERTGLALYSASRLRGPKRSSILLKAVPQTG